MWCLFFFSIVIVHIVVVGDNIDLHVALFNCGANTTATTGLQYCPISVAQGSAVTYMSDLKSYGFDSMISGLM